MSVVGPVGEHSAGESPMAKRSPKADIELSRVSVAENIGAVF
jgi:hypothetical protein